jgi:tetratricopeptide (TPR) repeat protein
MTNRVFMNRLGVGIACAALLLVSLNAFAGAQGRIMGTVTDGAGKPLEGVKIIITTPSLSNFKVELKTDKEGKWATILNDATMKYKYRFEKDGHLPAEQDWKVPVGATETLDIKLLSKEQAIEKGLVKVVEDPFTVAYNDSVDKLKADDLEGATLKIQEALKIGPEKAVAWDLAAKIAHKQKNWDKAVEYGEKALTLEPDNPTLYGVLMDAYRGKGDTAKVKEYQKKFASANPDDPNVQYNQAVELINKSDYKGAEPFLRKAVEIKPDFADAHFQLGMACMTNNKIPEMKKHLGEYLKLSPKGKDAAAAKEMLDAFK